MESNSVQSVQYEEPSEYTNSGASFSPRQFFNTLRRKWWIVLIAAILPIGPTFYYLRSQPVDYVSKSRMWVRGSLQGVSRHSFSTDIAKLVVYLAFSFPSSRAKQHQ